LNTLKYKMLHLPLAASKCSQLPLVIFETLCWN
jgi:hypothetical protein